VLEISIISFSPTFGTSIHPIINQNLRYYEFICPHFPFLLSPFSVGKSGQKLQLYFRRITQSPVSTNTKFCILDRYWACVPWLLMSKVVFPQRFSENTVNLLQINSSGTCS